MSGSARGMQVFVGYDKREDLGYQVTVKSLIATASCPIYAEPIVEAHCRATDLYDRRHELRDGRLYDAISNAPMATQFALTRFLIPWIADHRMTWALFCDCDFLFRRDIADLRRLADPSKAVMVVKHDHRPAGTEKMDGQVQTAYARKNWSSLMLWNLRHPWVRALTLTDVNSMRGLDLHQFKWLPDEAIGELPATWNWLAGYSAAEADPAAVHFTEGTPDMAQEKPPFADEWWSYLKDGGNDV